MRCYITSSLHTIEHSKEKHAYIIRIHAESKSFCGIYRAGNLASLTPWIRRAGEIPLPPLFQLHTQYKGSDLLPLRKDDFKKYLSLARQARTKRKIRLMIIPQGKFYQCIAQTEDKDIVLKIDRNPIALGKMMRKMQHQHPIERLSVVTDRLNDLINIQSKNFMIPQKGIRPNKVDNISPIDSIWSKKVVVFTNIANNNLPYLQKNLDFWARGVQGFRFKHIFGILTPARIERELMAREDCILAYRGHAHYTSKGVVWQLENGGYTPPAKSVGVYFHLACGNSHNIPLRSLPGHDNIITFAPIQDFDDAALFKSFLIQLRNRQRLASAFLEIQKVYPQFVHIQI